MSDLTAPELDGLGDPVTEPSLPKSLLLVVLVLLSVVMIALGEVLFIDAPNYRIHFALGLLIGVFVYHYTHERIHQIVFEISGYNAEIRWWDGYTIVQEEPVRGSDYILNALAPLLVILSIQAILLLSGVMAYYFNIITYSAWIAYTVVIAAFLFAHLGSSLGDIYTTYQHWRNEYSRVVMRDRPIKRRYLPDTHESKSYYYPPESDGD